MAAGQVDMFGSLCSAAGPHAMRMVVASLPSLHRLQHSDLSQTCSEACAFQHILLTITQLAALHHMELSDNVLARKIRSFSQLAIAEMPQ